MSTEHGAKSIIAALAANIGVALAKLVAFFFTGSSSLLTEFVHSCADCGNQILLLIGRHRSGKSADHKHNFGYGRRRYVYGFVVAVMLFLLGGVFSLYEGFHKWQHPEPLRDAWIAIVVLGAALLMEGSSFRVAVSEARGLKGKRSLLGFVKATKNPELPVILLEDFGALLGLVLALGMVVLSVITGNGRWDAVGAMSIGVLMLSIAIFLGVEMSAMLVGESALPEEAALIEQVLEDAPGIEEVLDVRTMHIGPDEVLVAVKITVSQTDSGSEITSDLEAAEDAIREAVPSAKHVYLDIEDPNSVDAGEPEKATEQGTPEPPLGSARP